jgi:TPR repeat protein
MKLLWKITVLVTCIAAMAGAAIAWKKHNNKVAAAAKLAEQIRGYRFGAAHGDPEAQVKLGRYYFYGDGVPQDFGEALRWAQQAAAQGYPAGEYSLGTIYYYGRGVSQDFATAALWFRKAADQGNARAQAQLGAMYVTGEGVPRDYAEALIWNRKAADQGDVRAAVDLGSMYYYGRAVSQDYTEAAHWYRKAADQGNAGAEYDVGYMDYYGKGVPQNHAEGRRWMRKAAAQGDDRALRCTRASLSSPIEIFLLIQLAGGLFFVLPVVPIRLNYLAEEPRELLTHSQKMSAAAGALFLLSAAYAWYGYTHLKFQLMPFGPNIWVVGRWLSDAIPVALMLYALRLERQREAAKDEGVLA